MTDHRTRNAARLGGLVVLLMTACASAGCGEGTDLPGVPGLSPPGIDLPRVGTLGRVPAGEGRVHVVIDGDGRISIDGVGPLDLHSLRYELEVRTEDPRWREPGGVSGQTLLLDVDSSAPWMVVQWVLRVAMEPRVGLYRVYLGARPWEDTGRGAIGITQPRDGGLLQYEDMQPPWLFPSLVVRLFAKAGQEADADPELLYDVLRAERYLLGNVRLNYEIRMPRPLGPAVPAGFVIRVLDVGLRAGGMTDLFIEGLPPPAGKAGTDVDALLARVAELKAPGSKVKMRFGRDRAFEGRPGHELRAPANARGLLPVLYGLAPDAEEPRLDDDQEFVAESETELDELGAVHETSTVVEEPAIPDADTADHVEPDSDLQVAEVPRNETISDTSFEGPTRNGLVGVGGGDGGAFHDRGRHRDLTNGQGRSGHAIDRALKWLAAHQSPNGGWGAATFMRWCDGEPAPQRPDGPGKAFYDPGVTGLALCAFLGDGYTHRGRHCYRKTVSRGLRYLRNIQDAGGCFGPRACHDYVYNHAACALAMVEAYGMTGSSLFKGSAQKALDFLATAQNPGLGWRYGVRPGDSDTSVTGWVVAVLHSAVLINRNAVEHGKPPPLTIEAGAFDGARAWIEKMTDPGSGRTGYIQRGGVSPRPQETIDRFSPRLSESMTACAILARIRMGEDPHTSEVIQKGARLCVLRPPVWDPAGGHIDMCYWYWGSQALYQVGGAAWKTWRAALIDALCESQHQDGTYCGLKGSWDPLGPWGADGGRVYATAMLAMCLEAGRGRHDREFTER